jgi:HlyD family secretion protein
MRARNAWVLVGAAAAMAAAFLGWRAVRGDAEAVEYRTDTIRRGDIRVLVSATGTLNAVVTVQVGSQVSGTIASLYADYNDEVRAGQVLAQLDPTFLRAQEAQSEAEKIRAEVELRKALRDSTRVFSLKAENLVSQADLDAAQTTVDAGRASLASAEAALERARTNLRYATITSPVDGVIVSRDVDVGQTVAASLSAPTLFTIAKDLTEMQLESAVDEADIGHVRAGQPATFTVDAYPLRRFKGQVHQIRLAPQVVQNVVTYTVVVLVRNPEKILLPGMTANVSILVDEAEDVLKVPAAALRFRLPEKESESEGEGEGRATGSERFSARERAEAPIGSGRGGRGGDAGGSPGGSGETGAGDDLLGGTVYLLDESASTPRPIPVRVGPSDGSFTAVFSDSIEEGLAVVVGAESGGGEGDREVVNPFMPRRRPGRGR